MARARQASHNAPGVLTPQGRLTLTTATPVMTAEAANQTTIYYTPYVGDRIPLYNGAEWENKLFTELSIAMAASANWAANSNFDLFVYNDAGTLRLVTGAAWTNDTTRAEALVRTNGIWLNNASFTGRYGASDTVSIAASRATYVGTFRTTGSAGTTTWELGGSAAGGDPGKLYLWNAYNRVRAASFSADNTDSWTYDATTTWRQPNATSATMRCSFVVGLAEDVVTGEYHGAINSPSGFNAAVGVALDATNTAHGVIGWNSGASTAQFLKTSGQYYSVVAIGHHYLQAVEYCYSLGGPQTFYGDAGIPNDFRTGLYVMGMF